MNRAGLLRFAILVATLFACAGCAREQAATDWVSQAREAHREADQLVAAGNAEAARQALEVAVHTEPPPATADTVARIVRQDLFYRIASLEIEDGNAELALDSASRGLALGEENDVFSANLRIVRGQAHEALGHRHEAAADYHAALTISEALLDQALGEETQ